MNKHGPVIDEVMRSIGFHHSGGGVYVRKRLDGIDAICLGGCLDEFLDAFYARAHREGWERGAYEEQQQEDVEKTPVTWLKGEVDFKELVAKNPSGYVIVETPYTPPKKKWWVRWFG